MSPAVGRGGNLPLHREHAVTPVTALAFYVSRATGRRYVLAGEDTDVGVYDVAAAAAAIEQPCAVLRVFTSQPVHGIAVAEDPEPDPDAAAADDDGDRSSTEAPPSRRILVWGGRSVRVFSDSAVEELLLARLPGSGSGRHRGAGSSGHSSSGYRVDTTAVATAPDWILDGRVSPAADGRVVLLTAHNEVIEATLPPPRSAAANDDEGVAQQSSLVFGRVWSPPSRPILYSGHLAWAPERRRGDGDGGQHVLVAAGTVFGEILVWRCRLDDDDHNHDHDDEGGYGHAARKSKRGGGGGGGGRGACEVLFVLSGHEGSVFGVHLSPELTTRPGAAADDDDDDDGRAMKKRLLVSCSDDRTVRVWDVSEVEEGQEERDEARRRRPETARHTGFGDSEAAAGEDAATTGPSRCVATAMGHISRIWQVGFPPRQALLREHGVLEIFSFGEDATAQKWHLHLDPGSPTPPRNDGGLIGGTERAAAELTHQETFSGHSGKHIWSHAMACDEGGSLLVATGGADGKIGLIRDASTGAPEEHTSPVEAAPSDCPGSIQVQFSLEDIARYCQEGEPPPPSVVPSTSQIRKAKHTLLVTTSLGQVFIADFGHGVRWRELAISDETRQAISSYAVIARSQATSMAFIGTVRGDLFCYRDREGGSLELLATMHGKINEIFCLSESNHSSAPVRYGTETRGKIASILRVDINASVPERAELTLDSKFIPTAASYHGDYLILGSRQGFVAILRRDDNGGYSTLLTFEVKLRESITSILPLPREDTPFSDQTPGRFLTTSRDGKYRVFEIIHADGGIAAPLVQETSPPFGPMIEGAWLSSPSGGEGGGSSAELLLCGFRSTYFVVWNATRREEVAAVDCGGAHRSFACTALSPGAGAGAGAGAGEEGLRLVYTKTSRMHVFAQTRSARRTLRAGVHGREIRALSAAADGGLVATGAEDTVVRIWEYESGRGELRCVAALEGHRTGIQTLRWCGDEYLFSSAGNEEFFVRLHRRHGGVAGLPVVREAVLADRSADGDLRIMDFDVEPLAPRPAVQGANDKGEDKAVDDADADADADADGPRFVITMALSNSTLQSYTYSRAAGFRPTPGGRRAYTGACLTQVRHLVAPAAAAVPRVVLAAATDGHLAVFSGGEDGGPDDDDDKSEGRARAGTAEEKRCSGGLTVTRLHQSSIKTLDVRRVRCRPAAAAAGLTGEQKGKEEAEAEGTTTTSYLVVTGGDDNALGIALIQLRHHRHDDHRHRSGETEVRVRSKCVIRDAHAAAITGIAIAPPPPPPSKAPPPLPTDGSGAKWQWPEGEGKEEEEAHGVIVVTAGNDQRIKVWRLVAAGGGRCDDNPPGGDEPAPGPAPAPVVRAQLLEDRYSGVADAGDLEVLRRDGRGGLRVMVAGVGFEVWRLGGRASGIA
ncbi:WD40-repeat-containing domain protein [Xylariaceae sp. FL0804]|nr:WD40-repeat-containing domain protein [Xylariaceae sp. FL0804]